MAMWSRTKRTAEPATAEVPVTSAAPRVAEDQISMARFERLIDASSRLREARVSHDDITRRAGRDAISFNEAVEFLDREHSPG